MIRRVERGPLYLEDPAGKEFSKSVRSVISIPFSGISYIFKNGSGLTYVVFGKKELHCQTLKLMDVHLYPHEIVVVDFLADVPEFTFHPVHWENLTHLSKFYYSVALEIFSLVVSSFQINLFKPSKLPDLDFFISEFKDWGPPSVLPLKKASIFSSLEKAISTVEKKLPVEIRTLADLASKVCREGFSRMTTQKISFGKSSLSLRAVKREKIRSLVYLLYLHNPDKLQIIEKFVEKAMQIKIDEIEQVFLRWLRKIEIKAR